ncbi:hypothetical protein BDE40_1896 [Litoreibacter halocynthiae]|uniref:Uncharacterized protein n=1 Tax=Litoreibacter halocynthiae TaxID=1242689 RepID=A0A4R7LIQ8_9RHOB|nr:hypothetical protein [Litoreibacter halocynthiae]TDT75169.1 hypothetical protein BDE40_1896 [Litoreibacter halocynthiae]
MADATLRIDIKVHCNMLTLKRNSVSALQNQVLRDFSEELVGDLMAADPMLERNLGVDSIREAVHLGIRSGQRYAIDERSPLKAYIQIMFHLGSHFDEDPLLPWAKMALVTPCRNGRQAYRINALRDSFLEYVEQTCGHEGEHISGFLRQLQTLNDPQDAPVDATQTLAFVDAHFASMTAYVGRNVIWSMMHETADLCRKLRLFAPSSVFILVCMRLSFGYGVTNDPLFPWLRMVLQNPAPALDKEHLLWQACQEHLANLPLQPLKQELHNGG